MSLLSWLIFFLSFAQPLFAVETPELPKAETYEQLVTAIRQVRSASQIRLEELVEHEKIREAWETGKLIDEHVLLHEERADYDKQVLLRLSKDLLTSDRELYYMLAFARAYPISPPASKLSWSDYRDLLSIKDDQERKEITQQAEKENWKRDRIRGEVRKRNSGKPEKPEEKLSAEPGKLYTYRIVKAESGRDKGERVVDLGFSNYYKPKEKINLKEGTIVTLKVGKKRDTLRRTPDLKKADLFTYNAYVRHVIDGDTFTAQIDLGFGIATVQKLRLRGLDAPEILTADGQEAKKYLEKRLRSVSPILIRTEKSDKYDRYLADVFVKEEYVNQALVGQGLALVVED